MNIYISIFAKKASYQNEKEYLSKSQKVIIKECELTIMEMEELKDYSSSINIDFINTIFEITSPESLVNININILKNSSCNLSNYPFLKRTAELGLPIYYLQSCTFRRGR